MVAIKSANSNVQAALPVYIPIHSYRHIIQRQRPMQNYISSTHKNAKYTVVYSH